MPPTVMAKKLHGKGKSYSKPRKQQIHKKAAAAAKKSTKKEEAAPAIENKAASTTLGDIDALAALKEQLEGKK